jgi:hypothetical protein
VDKPPTDRTASQDQKLIKTKHGHQVLLDDSQGHEAIRITTAGGHELILDDAGATVAITGNGVKITLDDTGSITVQGTTVTVEADQIALGSSAAALHPILGEEFMAIFNTHIHTLVPPLSIPTLPPVPPLTPAVFSQIVTITA